MNYKEKNKLLDKIAVVGLMAIFVEVFLYVVDQCFTESFGDLLVNMPTILTVLGVVFLAVAIVLYVMAYRKSNSSKAIYATEFLVLAFLCPFLTYWYAHSTGALKTISPKVLWGIVLGYYVIKVICTCVKAYLSSSSRQRKK